MRIHWNYCIDINSTNDHIFIDSCELFLFNFHSCLLLSQIGQNSKLSFHSTSIIVVIE